MSETIHIDKQAARRFILGRQGLWPGRRWEGKEGAVAALHAMEALQLDPLNITARSHDIALHSRVLDYKLAMFEEIVYQERRFFDYGGALYVYPMAERPYWAPHIKHAATWPRWARFAAEHPDTINFVRSAIRDNGPLGNRDFKGSKRIVGNYRGSKDTSLALYHLWMTGEVMVHHRSRFERVYDLTERILPPEHAWEASEEQAIEHFGRKTVAFHGFVRALDWKNALSYNIQRKLDLDEVKRRILDLEAAGMLVPVRVEGWKDTYYLLGEDLPLLETVTAGGVPQEWQPLGPTTLEEALILAPLDIVSARGRAMLVFGFDYKWDVYKPLEQRQWGYYNVPVLWGDRLVARMSPRLDRKTSTLVVTGFWADDPDLSQNPAFRAAFTAGLARFAAFIGAERTEAGPAEPFLSR